ncbi:ABC transporter substrate-binding protein [Candidatus Sulfurimonas marisnigri]|uniref:ABC transporter substrate-binding protein n=1 Tax=Candidatus Sulfurimonas marisnigri TaxID=2740405 RepID=A0A7S7LYR9_9BACT|nr:ABC transporter substrate-binding protein [Candidatus Sulfurimonas marisnigri]QOY53872.1 ABC transporter substrate-binding protein [Candidatus Sulfurimonas marisnigri]
MNKIFKKALLLFSILVFAQSLVADDKVELKEHFLKKIDEVVLIVKDNSLSKNDRNGNIIKSLSPMFDFELMAKLSLGNTWKQLASNDREKFIDLYVERMKQSYSSKIDAYKDEKVEVKEIQQPKNNRIALLTDLVSKEEKLEIVYKFYKPKKKKSDKDIWLIYDVEILGVSILKADKAQFKEFLQTKNISELMDVLAKRS